MIPKKIHYCWFGGNPIPEKDQKCIESWKKFCPDYEIIRWDESNYDITKNQYMKEAYEAQKWGFVPDYARLDILYNEGGIYLDTDVELLKSLDDLLDNKGYMGFEDKERINPGLGIGAEKHNPTIKKIMDDIYSDRRFVKKNGFLDLTPSPKMNTELLMSMGLIINDKKQVVGELTIYPTEYFCPKSYETEELNITERTYSIHWFNASWHTAIEIKMRKTELMFTSKFGIKTGKKIARIVNIPYRIVNRVQSLGLIGFTKFVGEKIKSKIFDNEH